VVGFNKSEDFIITKLNFLTANNGVITIKFDKEELKRFIEQYIIELIFDEFNLTFSTSELKKRLNINLENINTTVKTSYNYIVMTGHKFKFINGKMFFNNLIPTRVTNQFVEMFSKLTINRDNKLIAFYLSPYLYFNTLFIDIVDGQRIKFVRNLIESIIPDNFEIKLNINLPIKFYEYISRMKFNKIDDYFIYKNIDKLKHPKKSLKINDEVSLKIVEYSKDTYKINEKYFYFIKDYKNYISKNISYKIQKQYNSYTIYIFQNIEKEEKLTEFFNNIIKRTQLYGIKTIDIDKIIDSNNKYFIKLNDIGKIFESEISKFIY